MIKSDYRLHATKNSRLTLNEIYRSKNVVLAEVYKSYSFDKEKAYQNCLSVEEWLTGSLDTGVITSHNSYMFTYSFYVPLRSIEAFSTKTNKRLYKNVDLGLFAIVKMSKCNIYVKLISIDIEGNATDVDMRCKSFKCITYRDKEIIVE